MSVLRLKVDKEKNTFFFVNFQMFFLDCRHEISEKGLIWTKNVENGWKKSFNQLLGARSTQKLVKTHNKYCSLVTFAMSLLTVELLPPMNICCFSWGRFLRKISSTSLIWDASSRVGLKIKAPISCFCKSCFCEIQQKSLTNMTNMKRLVMKDFKKNVNLKWGDVH